MATDVTIGGAGSGQLFIGTDKVLRFEVLDTDDAATIAAGGGNPRDMSGKTLIFDVRKLDNSPDPALLQKTPTVTGVFNVSRALNTQRVLVTLTDDDLAATRFKGSNLPKNAQTYRWSIKILDAGEEEVFSRGDFAPEKATAE